MNQQDIVFHITPHEQMFSQSLPNQSNILGYYSKDSKRIFIKPRKWLENEIQEMEFYITILHEYIHYKIDSILNGKNIPKWYEEGIAQALSVKQENINYGLLEHNYNKCNSIILFDDNTFSPCSGESSIAYLQAHAIVCFLMKNYGQTKLINVINQVGETDLGFQDVFENIFGIKLEKLDKQWRSIIKNEFKS